MYGGILTRGPTIIIMACHFQELWVLQGGTLTLKTTDTTTLVSVDGDNGPMGALTHLPSASPETITEVARFATVTVTLTS